MAYSQDPATNLSIARQNALTNATNLTTKTLELLLPRMTVDKVSELKSEAVAKLTVKVARILMTLHE